MKPNQALLEFFIKLVACISISISISGNLSAQDKVKPNRVNNNGESQSVAINLEQEAKKRTAEFARTLNRALTNAIQTHGFSYAIDVCKSEAPKIAAQLSTDGWVLARTSLKTRNKKNQPDEWETQMLVEFDAGFKSGKTPIDLTASLVEEGSYRFMKAIPTGQVCLACHGQSIEPALTQKIRSHYPGDTATGYTLKDIRGAFTLWKTLEH